MADYGYGLQVVQITENHSYVLDEHALEQILMTEEVKDLPVVVMSVAGAYRGGKSFLLNFFIRYLKASQSAREDGSWLGEDSEPLVGFKWRHGIRRTTMGILMWSEPFVTTLPSGDKVAVLLIDTQGTFDNRSTVRDCSTIFALSTLLSSVQIYNLSHNIQEDDMQHLHLFTEYGKLVKDEGMKAFQVLEFLVRDWQFQEEYAYGATGGEQLLQERLEITPDLPKEMQELREHIRSSFEKVSCFLMPHPGFKVLNPNFKGNIVDIDIEFRRQLIDLVNSLFSPEKLVPKTINGEQIKARDLFQYFKTYMALFNSDTIPNPTNIFKATVKAGFLAAVNEANNIYEKGMDSECGPKQLSIPAVDVQELHRKYVAAAREAFTTKKRMGSQEEADKYLEKLMEGLEKRLPQFLQINLSKIQTAVNNAKDAYEEVIRNIAKDQTLCVHPLDLDSVHKSALDAAIKIFDAARKRITNKKDDERDHFIKNFELRYKLLQLSNEQNNKLLVSELRMEYWKHMQAKGVLDAPLYAEEFRREHEYALQKAINDFDSRRNIASHHADDVFKYNLTMAITESFIQMKKINKSNNKVVINAAVEEYNNYMNSAWNHKTQFLHPDDFEREHLNGVCHAFKVLRPKKDCSEGLDYNDEDDITLNDTLKQRYEDLKANNNYANETAVQEAFNGYANTLIDICQPFWMWITIIPIALVIAKRIQDHEPLKRQTIDNFLSKRKDGDSGQHSSDKYKDKLIQMIDTFYNGNQCAAGNGNSVAPIIKHLGEVIVSKIGESILVP